MIAPGISAADALARVQAIDNPAIRIAECGDALLGVGSQEASSHPIPILTQDIWGNAADWFFIGDIHGDFFALHQLVTAIRQASENFHIVFLGDMVDRGPHGLECALYFLALAAEFPGRMVWIAGNHDVGLAVEEQGTFSSSVLPAEFARDLNDQPSLCAVGQAFIDLAHRLPRALITPDGLLVTHGGFPHVDLQEQVDLLTPAEKLAWLASPDCLRDFTWTRITRYPAKLPNRTSTGCSYGHLDFARFSDLMADIAPVKRLLTGHDHPDGGVDHHKKWEQHPALTITGYGFGDDYRRASAWGVDYRDQLFYARGVVGDAGILLDVISVPVNKVELELFAVAYLGKLIEGDLALCSVTGESL